MAINNNPICLNRIVNNKKPTHTAFERRRNFSTTRYTTSAERKTRIAAFWETSLFMNNPLLFFNASNVELYSNGDPKSGTLSRDATVGGYPCKGGTRVELYPGRRLKMGTLSRNVPVGKKRIPCKGDSEIKFHKNGVLEMATLSHRFTFQNGIALKDWIRLHANGRLHKSTLAEPALIKFSDVTIRINGRVEFFVDGFLNRADLVSPVTIDKVDLAPGYIKFYPTGILLTAVLSGDQDVQGVPCKGGESVFFHKSGRLSSATISRNVTDGNITTLAGARLQFNEKGEVEENGKVWRIHIIHTNRDGNQQQTVLPPAPQMMKGRKMRGCCIKVW